MTEAERIKLTILLHQHTPTERLSSMEISAMLLSRNSAATSPRLLNPTGRL